MPIYENPVLDINILNELKYIEVSHECLSLARNRSGASHRLNASTDIFKVIMLKPVA